MTTFVMLNLFQHPSCRMGKPVPDEEWTLKRVQGDEERNWCGDVQGFKKEPHAKVRSVIAAGWTPAFAGVTR